VCGGLPAKIDRLWHRNEGYYLGEWHFHPFGSPMLSTTDGKQLQKSRRHVYTAVLNLCMILLGDRANPWTMRAFVFQQILFEVSYLPDCISRRTDFGSHYADAYSYECDSWLAQI
jgi:hypothetical protein